jgi:hypothetical protein
MRYPFLVLLALLAACGSSEQQNDADIPQVFQEPTVLKNIKEGSLRSGYGSSLVEALFAEEVERDTALARLIMELDEEPRSHAQGTNTFYTYDAHINRYHDDAGSHYRSIRDTVMRRAAHAADSVSMARYGAMIAPHRLVLSNYESLAVRNKDLLTVLKLRRSRIALENYRDKNLPDKAVLDRELERLKKLEQRLEQQLGM